MGILRVRQFWLIVPCGIAPASEGEVLQPEPGLATMAWSLDTKRTQPLFWTPVTAGHTLPATTCMLPGRGNNTHVSGLL